MHPDIAEAHPPLCRGSLAIKEQTTVVPITNILEHARRNPGRIAVVHNGEFLSYGAFARWIAASRASFSRQELPSAGVAVVCLRGIMDCWIAGMALRSLGLTTVVPRNPNLVEELGLRNISCVVTAAGASHPTLDGLAADGGWRMLRFDADRATAAKGPLPALTELPAATGGHILLTSGTTGLNKKLLRDPALETRSLPQLAAIYGITDQSVAYVANFGLWTAGGYRWPLVVWSMGGAVVIHQELDLHQPLLDHAMTHVFTTPDMFAALLRAAKGAFRRDDTARLLVTGSGMPKTLLDTAKRHVTRHVCSVLASTEASVLGITPLEDADDLLWHKIHPSRDVQVVDEAGRVVAPGEVGQVRVRPADGITGYLDDDAATRTFFRDGYFYPGDLGVIREDGRLCLHGRSSDVVNILGNKIAMQPFERALRDRLGVEAVCIVSVPGKNHEDEIVVAIQAERMVDQAKVDEAVGVELKMLRAGPIRVAWMDRFPRNDMGKIERFTLKRLLRSGGHQ